MIIAIIEGTPIYVWVILVVLILRGLKQFKARDVHQRALVIIPALFMILAIHRLVTLDYAAAAATGLALGALVGVGLVLAIRPQRRLKAAGENTVHIEGEWHTLVMVLTLFAALYVQNAGLAVNPELGSHPMFMATVNFFVGLATGFSVTRSAAYIHKARTVLNAV